jgi:DNA repair protein RadC
MNKTSINKQIKELLKSGAYQDALDALMHVCEPKGHVRVPPDAYEYMKKYSGATRESFFVILLNGSNEIIGHERITTGLVNRTIVHPREVFKPAIIKSCSAVILCHNHPSGNLTPSQEDIDITERLKKAGEIIGIPVLDHIIISRNGYTSMVELRLF